MTKWDFLTGLRNALRGLPQETIDEQLAFYSEMIDDRMDDGVPEDAAVAGLGDVRAIAQTVLADVPLTKLVKESVKSQRRFAAWEIALLVVGSPVWLSLLIALVAVALSLYVSLWAIMIALWAVFASLIGSAVGALLTGIVFICLGNIAEGIALIGAAMALTGLSIFAFFGCKASTYSLLLLTKLCFRRIKRLFLKKENAR